MEVAYENTTPDRQLVVVLFADIVNYTALMQKNEAFASMLLDRFRKEFNAKVQQYNGNIVQFYGDGALCTFINPLEATRCAMNIQRAFQNTPKVPLRIGIHSGTVVFKSGIAYGNCINVAARIESMGVPGSIILSRQVRRELKNHPEFSFASLGEFKFKNVEEPVEVFAISNQGYVIPKKEEMKGKFQKTPSSLSRPWLLSIALLGLILLVFLGKDFVNSFKSSSSESNQQLSIAVLPFDNMSGEDEQFLVAGVTEDILTQISKLSNLKVISRFTLREYNSRGKTPKQIGKELNVAFLLGGSVRRQDNRLRIGCQLIKTKDESEVWAESYDRKMTNVFDLQSEIAHEVSRQLQSTLTKNEVRLINQKPTTQVDAYLAYLKGLEKHTQYDKNLNDAYLDTAMQYYNKAIQIDSLFAMGYAALAKAIWDKDFDDNFYKDHVVDTVQSICEKALQIDANLAEAYDVRARCHRANSDYENQRKDLLKIIELNPNFSTAYLMLGEHFFRINGAYEKALEYLQEALLRSRGEELAEVFRALCWFYLELGMFEEAMLYGKKEKEIRSWSIPLFWTLIHQGDYKDARVEAIEYQSLHPQKIQGLWHLAISNLYLGDLRESESYFRQLMQLFESGGKDHRLNRYRHRFGYLLWVTGRKEAAIEHFEESIKYLKSGDELNRNRARDNNAYNLAAIAAFLGNREDAYYWLNQMNEFGWHWGYPYHIKRDPMFAPLRQEKRFRDLVDKVLEDKAKIRKRLVGLETAQGVRS